MERNIRSFCIYALGCFSIILGATSCIERNNPPTRTNIAFYITREAMQEINRNAIYFDIANKAQICMSATDEKERYDKEMIYFPHFKIRYENEGIIINDLCTIKTNGKDLTADGSEWIVRYQEGDSAIIKKQPVGSYLVENKGTEGASYSFVALNDSIYKTVGSHSYKSGCGKNVECNVLDSVSVQMPSEYEYVFISYNNYIIAGSLKLELKNYEDGVIHSVINGYNMRVEFQGETDSF